LWLFNDKWYWLFVVVAALVFTFGIIIFFFLVPHPKDIGIVVEEMSEKEILLAAVTSDDKNFEEIIEKGSTHRSQDVV
jgi:uncharacterized protein YpmS